MGLGRTVCGTVPLYARSAISSCKSPATARVSGMNPKPRCLGTFFGKVRYWRTYFYREGGGYYPLDRVGIDRRFQYVDTELGGPYRHEDELRSDRPDLDVVSAMVAGSKEHRMVLGLGRHTGDWFEAAPAPEGDGEVLVIQIDSKATPTATEEELEKRRGPRRENPHPWFSDDIDGEKHVSGEVLRSGARRATNPRTERWLPLRQFTH